MASLGGWEWVIILVIVILVFGVGRISRIGSELGRGIRAFRDGMRDEKDTEKGKDSNPEDNISVH